MRRLVLPALPVLLALSLAGCGSGDSDTATASSPSPGDASLLVPYGEELPAAGERAAGGEAALSGATGTGGSTSGGSSSGSTATAPDAAADSSAGAPAPTDAALRAGSVDDNARFEDYLDYRTRNAGRIGADALDVRERHVVTVWDRDGKPVLGARVTLTSGDRELQTARTHADGRALIFPRVTGDPDATSYGLVVRYLDQTVRGEIADRSVRSHDLALTTARPDAPARVDLHFLLDTTGSMDDELARLRTTLDDVARQIDALPQQPEVRYGLTVYKDQGDDYVSRTGEFTDLATFRAELERVSAGGGGDTPEALDEALHGAVGGPAWDSDRAIQIAFLVADASPHLGDRGVSYADDVKVAAAKGIEVVPLAASGTDDPAEYVFRQLAQYSQGTFFFLTYGADGRSPGDSTDRDVSGFTTGSLDELIVKHVASRLAAYDGRGAGQ